MLDTVVIGAGISGLSAAWTLHRTGRSIQVLEAGAKTGGLIDTVHDHGFVTESGPNTFPSKAAEILDLCRALHLQPQPATPKAQKRYLFLKGRLMSLPQHPLEFFTNPFLSVGGKIRLLQEPRMPQTTADDISLADFFTRRIGAEATRHLLDPFISGIYAGDINQLSLPAVFPTLWQWEQEHGSLVRGGLKNKRKPRGAPMQLLGFENGMQTLTDALTQALPSESIRLQCRVDRIEQANGQHYRIHTSSDIAECREIILAVPAFSAANLLQALVPQAAEALRAIPYAPLAVVHTGLPASAIQHPLDGFGCLVPRREKLNLLGTIWTSSLFPHRAPKNHILLSSYIGGAHQPDIAAWDDDRIEAQVLQDLCAVFKPASLAPVYRQILKYQQAIPQYTLGHGQRIQHIETALSEHPGLALCGNYLHGVALNECVKSGLNAAAKMLRTT